MLKVKLKGAPKPRNGRVRDLQRDEASARTQHAVALGEEFTEVNKITEQECIRYNVNTGVLQRQGENICLQELHRGSVAPAGAHASLARG